jgi:hypothetical protein
LLKCLNITKPVAAECKVCKEQAINLKAEKETMVS